MDRYMKGATTVNENLKAFLQKFVEDEELQAKFQGVEDVDTAYALASSIQGGFTKEEFVDTMTELSASTRELSDEELEAVAGGTNTTPITIGVTISTPISTVGTAIMLTGGNL